MLLRAADPADCAELTRVALAAKRHWGYPEAWIELWRDELAYTPARFDDEAIFVAEIDGAIAAVCSLSCAPPEAELEGLWVLPAHMGRGLGRALFDRAVAAARASGCARLVIVADPGALPFYQRMGAAVVGTSPSRPAGRTLPRLQLALG